MTRMNSSQLMVSIVLGVVFWFSAAVMIRSLDRVLVDSPVVVFAATLAATYPLVLGVRALLRLEAAHVVEAVSVMTAAAAFCDGVALTWYAGLYGPYGREAGAVILWGAAAGLAWSVVVSRVLARA